MVVSKKTRGMSDSSLIRSSKRLAGLYRTASKKGNAFTVFKNSGLSFSLISKIVKESEFKRLPHLTELQKSYLAAF